MGARAGEALSWLVDVASAAAERDPWIGPKARRLATMAHAGLPVPPAVILPATLGHAVVGEVSDPAEARRRCAQATLPAGLRAELGRALESLDVGAGVAVRSAGLDEDAAEASAAGVYRSELAVHGLEDVVAAVRACWASQWDAPALAYAERWGSEPGRGMSVIVQRMVEPRAAGVLFTGPDDSSAWIEAVAGRGEALVSGSTDPVRYRTRGEAWSVEGEPAGLLPPAQRDLLLGLARQAEGVLERGLDLEWAWGSGEEGLVLLQARPITSALPSGERTLWTAANSQEALLDPVTPLTWTLFTPLVEAGRRALFRFAGLREIDADYMRLFRGRPYFSPDYFRAFLRQVPGAPENVFDALIFSESPPEIEFRLPEFNGTTLRLLGLFVASRVLARERFEAFQRLFELRLKRLNLRPLSTLYDGELLELRERATTLLEDALNRHVLGTAIAGGSYLLLDLFLRHTLEEGAHGLASRLTSGASGNALATASVELEGLARSWSSLGSEERERAFVAFLERNGHRCEKEAELLEPRWADDPRPVREVLERYVEAAEAGALTDLRERERGLRERALQLASEVSERLGRGRFERWFPARRLLFAYLLRESRRYAPYRENLKDRALRALHLLRRVFLEQGRRLAARGQLERAEDVFFVELEALEEALRTGADLHELAGRARAEREHHLGEEAPDTLVEVPGREPQPIVSARRAGGACAGVGVSSGRVTGTARVLSDMQEAGRLAPGEILIARVINAAWTPLFHLAGGIVAEVGGVLSHGAIVAREYGVPAVFGAAGACEIPDGARVCVDGDLGVITRVDQGPEPAGE